MIWIFSDNLSIISCWTSNDVSDADNLWLASASFSARPFYLALAHRLPNLFSVGRNVDALYFTLSSLKLWATRGFD